LYVWQRGFAVRYASTALFVEFLYHDSSVAESFSDKDTKTWSGALENTLAGCVEEILVYFEAEFDWQFHERKIIKWGPGA
jgi:hypothetical protein